VPPRPRRTSRPRGSVRRRTSWARFDGSIVVAAVNQQTTVDLLQPWKTAGGAQQGVTVARTRLRVIPVSGVPVANNSIHIGLLKGQFGDVGTNIVGAPNPSVDLNEDYRLWDKLVADDLGQLWPGGGAQAIYDIKSMTRLPQLEETYNLSVSSVSWPAFPLTVRVVASILLKLP